MKSHGHFCITLTDGSRTVTCRQFSNLTFAPRKTRTFGSATSRFFAIMSQTYAIIKHVLKKIKWFFKKNLFFTKKVFAMTFE